MTAPTPAPRRKRVSIDCSKDGRTKQSFQKECDINNIMKQYEKTRVITHVASASPRYGDFSNVIDYQSALNLVIDAQQGFDDLPADIRTRFMNDPAVFLDFVEDPENLEEGIKLGIFPKPEPHVPTPPPAPEPTPEPEPTPPPGGEGGTD